MASLIEVQDASTIRLAQMIADVNTPRGTSRWKPPKPLEVPRPWDTKRPKVRRKATAEDMAAIFGDRMRGGE